MPFDEHRAEEVVQAVETGAAAQAAIGIHAGEHLVHLPPLLQRAHVRLAQHALRHLHGAAVRLAQRAIGGLRQRFDKLQQTARIAVQLRSRLQQRHQPCPIGGQGDMGVLLHLIDRMNGIFQLGAGSAKLAIGPVAQGSLKLAQAVQRGGEQAALRIFFQRAARAVELEQRGWAVERGEQRLRRFQIAPLLHVLLQRARQHMAGARLTQRTRSDIAPEQRILHGVLARIECAVEHRVGEEQAHGGRADARQRLNQPPPHHLEVGFLARHLRGEAVALADLIRRVEQLHRSQRLLRAARIEHPAALQPLACDLRQIAQAAGGVALEITLSGLQRLQAQALRLAQPATIEVLPAIRQRPAQRAIKRIALDIRAAGDNCPKLPQPAHQRRADRAERLGHAFQQQQRIGAAALQRCQIVLRPQIMRLRQPGHHLRQALIEQARAERLQRVARDIDPAADIAAIGGGDELLIRAQRAVQAVQFQRDGIPGRGGGHDLPAVIERAQRLARAAGGLLADDVHVVGKRHGGIGGPRQRGDRQHAVGQMVVGVQAVEHVQ